MRGAGTESPSLALRLPQRLSTAVAEEDVGEVSGIITAGEVVGIIGGRSGRGAPGRERRVTRRH